MRAFILFVLAIWLLNKLGVFRFMFRSIITRAVKNQYKENSSSYNKTHRKEGEIYINDKDSPKGRTGDTGDYVDYEEIK